MNRFEEIFSLSFLIIITVICIPPALLSAPQTTDDLENDISPDASLAVEDEDIIFLKTIIPSRKIAKMKR
jgi:hypothetical protein